MALKRICYPYLNTLLLSTISTCRSHFKSETIFLQVGMALRLRNVRRHGNILLIVAISITIVVLIHRTRVITKPSAFIYLQMQIYKSVMADEAYIWFYVHRFLYRLILPRRIHGSRPIKESLQNTDCGQLVLTRLMTEF